MTRAFTMIEMIVVIATTSLVITALTTLILFFYRTNTYTLEESIAVGQARSGVEATLKYLREASYASDGAFPVASAATSSISFYANTNGGGVVERVTYKLVSGTLYQVVATPSGNPVTYVGASLATSTISTSVVNGTSTPLFRYYDSTGTELPSPPDVSAISSVQITAVVDVNVTRSPVSFTLIGQATLRNLKLQL